MSRRAVSLLGLIPLLAGCGLASELPRGRAVRAPEPRVGASVSPADAAALRAGNCRFAGRLLAALARKEPTVAISPYSISEALAMAYAGARGTTAAQMAGALGFDLPPARLAAAFNAAGRALADANRPQVRLEVANALYGQDGEPFRTAFLRVLVRDYGAGMRTVDFAKAPDAARAAINDWVSTRTAGRIRELIGPGELDEMTRLVIVNAVYLHAKWLSPFTAANAFPAPFHAPGGPAEVPTKHQTGTFRYARHRGSQVLELPYAGGRLAFDIVLPDRGQIPALLDRLVREGPLPLLHGLTSHRVAVALPKFRVTTRVELARALGELGMPVAFEAGAADLSGIAGPPGDLYVKAVVHQAYLDVDEAGTEAAAATGVIVAPSSAEIAPALRFNVDRPFAFVLRDTHTDAVLFCGVVSRT